MKLLLLSSVLILGGVAAFYYFRPLFSEINYRDRVTAVTDTLRTMHTAQAQFHDTHKRFGTIQELADAGLIGQNYAEQKTVSGFVYSDAPPTADAYCIHADRVNDDIASHDFKICQDARIRYINSSTKGTVPCDGGLVLGGT